uniref:hybrid sensor histidine kinase/response regulator transcription factor n=1 Tax=Bacteroides ovatus TaxID=28116 RepID=UPI00359C330A
MKHIYVIFALVFFMIAKDSKAQVFQIKNLNVTFGLSNDYITDFAQDRKGSIWIATEFGLNRLTGSEIRVFNKNNSALVGNEINTLYYDETEDALWIGTQRNGISVLNCRTQEITNLTTDDGLPTNDVTRIFSTGDNSIWITHYHGKITHFDKKSRNMTILDLKQLLEKDVHNWCSMIDDNRQLFIGHAHEGMSVIDLKSKNSKRFKHDPYNPESIPSDNVRCIYQDSKKNIWIATDGGLALFNPDTEKFVCFHHNPDNPRSLLSDNVMRICEMSDGTLWVSSDVGGISILNLRNISFVDPEKVQFQRITVANGKRGLTSIHIRPLFQDRADNIWIGNYGNGVDFIGHLDPYFQILPYMIEQDNKLKYKPAYALCSAGHRKIWIGSDYEIAQMEENRVLQKIPLPISSSRPYSQVTAMKADREGYLWIGLLNDGIYRIHPQKDKKFEHISQDCPINNIWTFFESSDGKIWIGTDNGIYSYFQGQIAEEVELNKQLSDKVVYSLLCDHQGRLWVGTFGKGVFVFDKNDKLIIHLSQENGFCSNAVYHIYMDSQENIWVATRNGVGYFPTNNALTTFQILDEKQGLRDEWVRALCEDLQGNIWLSTNKSLSKWDKGKKVFENYDADDGIPTSNFYGGSVYSSPEGKIYFGSLGGICCFSPQDLTQIKSILPVEIVECKRFDDRIGKYDEEVLVPSDNDSIIHLPYDKNTFRILFAVPDYSQNNQVEYAYAMEGISKDWHEIQNEHQAVFRDMAPGNYIFKVKSCLRNQPYDESHIASIKIFIAPPLWLTWYAKLIYVLLVCLIGYFLLRSYLNKCKLKNSLELESQIRHNEQELNNERLRFYTNITHELRTPLTLILGPLEDLITDPNLPESYRKKINIIHGSGMRLLNLINQILEFRKTETQNKKLTVSKGDLANLVMEIGLRHKELNRNSQVSIHIDVETEHSFLYYDTDVITTILNNLLSNAIKYTPEGEIHLILRSVTEDGYKYTEIAVRDTGYGIETQALPHIFDRYYQVQGKHQASGTGIGLALVKSLADLHGGILNVESQIGKGTTFSLRLLTENTYPDAMHQEEKSLPEASPKDDEKEGPEEEMEQRPVILVVEDNADIREYIISSFTSEYKVLEAVNGKKALEIALNCIPNIVISDIMMPEMDGIELCRSLKEDMRTSHIPVILLTAKDSIRDKEEGYENGADSYLTKPFSAKLLHSRVYNLLESRKKLAQLIADRTKASQPEEDVESLINLNKLDTEFLKKLTDLIEANLESEKLDLNFMTDKMNMSHSTFYRKVKGLTGLSANEFIRKVKLKNSMQLLKSRRYTIKEVAYMTGFNHLSYFRECFKKEFGVSPSDILK